MDEPVDVEASFAADGHLQPRSFDWNGRRHIVASAGRTWTEAGEVHYLVMTPDERVFELAYATERAAWRLRRAPAGPERRPT